MNKINLKSFSIFIHLFFFSILQFIPENSEAAVFRAYVKKGDNFEYKIPGKLLVKRIIKKTNETQYLWAGSSCNNDNHQRWTTDGVN
jgi:hypothetical protein